MLSPTRAGLLRVLPEYCEAPCETPLTAPELSRDPWDRGPAGGGGGVGLGSVGHEGGRGDSQAHETDPS